MLAKVMSSAIVGLEAQTVEVEVDISRGQPFFSLVGLPDAAVRESRDRVFAAIRNSALRFPANKRITVNLAPADLRKEGPAYGLPIAVGILVAAEQVWPDRLDGAIVVGELSLDGGVRQPRASCPWPPWPARKGYRGPSSRPSTPKRPPSCPTWKSCPPPT
jgi:magnesium chelatase family protein